AEFTEAVAAFSPLRVREQSSGGTRTPSLHVASDPAFVARERPEFGRRLKAAIRGRYPSDRQLAMQLGVSPGSVCMWTQGKYAPDPVTFGRISELLGVEPSALAPEGFDDVRKNKNALRRWMAELGLWGQGSHGKFIPPGVFRLTRPLVALFLNCLFATDGWATVLSGGQAQIGYATVSERLARQVQHLLLRFGVIASLRRRAVKYRDERRICWQLDVT